MGGDEMDDADYRSKEAVVGTCPDMCPGKVPLPRVQIP